jgi:hypothetical protein
MDEGSKWSFHSRGLRIATRCDTVEQFVAKFHRFCDVDAIFIPHASREPGTDTAFSFDLSGGKQALCGLGTVREHFPTAENRFRRPGIVIAISRLQSGSDQVFQDLLVARAIAINEFEEEAATRVVDAKPRTDRETPLPVARARGVTGAIEIVDSVALKAALLHSPKVRRSSPILMTPSRATSPPLAQQPTASAKPSPTIEPATTVAPSDESLPAPLPDSSAAGKPLALAESSAVTPSGRVQTDAVTVAAAPSKLELLKRFTTRRRWQIAAIAGSVGIAVLVFSLWPSGSRATATSTSGSADQQQPPRSLVAHDAATIPPTSEQLGSASTAATQKPSHGEKGPAHPSKKHATKSQRPVPPSSR